MMAQQIIVLKYVKISKKYKNITLINKKNGGLSSARNAGITAANGDYIAFWTVMIGLYGIATNTC